jgi:hypothetical protein
LFLLYNTLLDPCKTGQEPTKKRIIAQCNSFFSNSRPYLLNNVRITRSYISLLANYELNTIRVSFVPVGLQLDLVFVGLGLALDRVFGPDADLDHV